MLLRNPGLNLAAIATLALGMGATTCVFSVLEAVLVKKTLFEKYSLFFLGPSP